MPYRRRVAVQLELEWSYKHHAEVFAGTQLYAQEHDWDSYVDEYASDSLTVKSNQEVPYDGVIARASTALADVADRLEIPLVNVYHGSPAFDRLPGVFSDTDVSGKLRADHLLSRGLRRFAVLVGRGRAEQGEATAFCAAIKRSGCPCIVANVPLHFARTLSTWRKTEQTVARWMDKWTLPIGVFVGPNDICRNLVQTCLQRGWRVPEDVAVVAGSNEVTICESARPTLTSVEKNYHRVGYESARLLDRLMDRRLTKSGRIRKNSKKSKPTSPQHIFLPPSGLVLRESTDFFVSDDPDVARALAYIAANSHTPIRVDDVAEAVLLETRTLRNRFKKHLGRSIVDEIRRVRVEAAKRHLVQGNLTLNEIAKAVGFLDAHRMYEIFSREYGVSPSEYRKRHRLERE